MRRKSYRVQRVLIFLKGWVRAEQVEQGHMTAENNGEHQRMIGMKFYITVFPP